MRNARHRKHPCTRFYRPSHQPHTRARAVAPRRTTKTSRPHGHETQERGLNCITDHAQRSLSPHRSPQHHLLPLGLHSLRMRTHQGGHKLRDIGPGAVGNPVRQRFLYLLTTASASDSVPDPECARPTSRERGNRRALGQALGRQLCVCSPGVRDDGSAKQRPRIPESRLSATEMPARCSITQYWAPTPERWAT